VNFLFGSTPTSTARRKQFMLPHRGHWINVVDRGEGDPLLLIMGLGGSVDMWDDLIEQLPHRRIIAFDAPGTGMSSLPAIAVTVPELADLAAGILDHCRINAADVLGFSYGGAVAQQLAVQHPRRVRKLVLAATTCGVGTHPAPEPLASGALGSPWRYYSKDYFKRTAALVYGGVVGRDNAIQDRLSFTRSQHPPHPYGYFLQLAGGSGWSSLSFLADIEQPTLILIGDEDPLVPVDAARQVAGAIPHAELRVFDGSGHLLLLDEPARTAGVIDDFLGSHSRPL
jgi:pimeloyl-ACP methyl ester carboxylesterase